MLVDWLTVGAQIVNFLILVVLLKYLLFDRIVAAMDRREEKINSRLEEAKEKVRKAEQEETNYRDRLGELNSKQEAMLSKAESDAASRRKELMKKARDDVDQLQEKWVEGVEQQRDSFLNDLKQRVGAEVVNISRKVLMDLATADVEQQAVEIFIKRIQELNKEKRKEIAASLGKSDIKVTVRSASEVSSQGKQKITKTLREGVSSSLEIDYETSPDMILGIEVKTPGNKIAWNIDDYLESLKSLISEKLDERIKAEGTKHNNEDTDGSDKKESGTDNQ